MSRNYKVVGLLLLAALLLSACQPVVAQPQAPPSEEEVAAAVNAIWDEYEASVIAGDVDRWIAQWTEDGVQMPPNAPFFEGKEHIYARVGANMAAGPTDELVITPLEITSAGDWAYSRGVYTVTFPLGDGEEGFLDGKFMTILQRQPDGSWKIHRDIFNSNVPPAPAAAPTTDAAEVAAAIDAVWREYEASQIAGDPDRWIALWAEDGVQLPPGSPPVVGKAAIDARDRSDLEVNEYSQFVITNREVEVNGDLAFARGDFRVTVAPKSGGDPMDFEGKYMTIFRQQPDGSWKIYRDIFNPSAP